jgi:hypothetical protein
LVEEIRNIKRKKKKNNKYKLKSTRMKLLNGVKKAQDYNALMTIALMIIPGMRRYWQKKKKASRK